MNPELQQQIDAIDLTKVTSTILGEIGDEEITLDVTMTDDQKKFMIFFKTLRDSWVATIQEYEEKNKAANKTLRSNKKGSVAELNVTCEELEDLSQKMRGLERTYHELNKTYQAMLTTLLPMLTPKVVKAIYVREGYIVTYIPKPPRGWPNREMAQVIAEADLSPVG